MPRSITLGYFILALAQVAISLNVVTSKHLLETMPMFTVLASRFFVSSIILTCVLKLTRTKLTDSNHPTGTMTRNDWFLTILQGIFAAFLFNVFFVWGLQSTTATAAGIIGSTLPAIIALSAVWLLKERLDLAKITGLLLAILGILVINMDQFQNTNTNQHSYFGDFLIFLAMFPEAWYSIISRKLASRVTPLGAALIANLVGFLTLLPCALFTGSFVLSNYSWIGCFFILVAGISSLVFFWAWGWGLSFIPASTASIFGGIMPVATTLFALVFLNEQLHWYDSLGMLLVILSIVIGTGWRFPQKKVISSAPF